MEIRCLVHSRCIGDNLSLWSLDLKMIMRLSKRDNDDTLLYTPITKLELMLFPLQYYMI